MRDLTFDKNELLLIMGYREIISTREPQTFERVKELGSFYREFPYNELLREIQSKATLCDCEFCNKVQEGNWKLETIKDLTEIFALKGVKYEI